jgi:soluble lytic murein transglycosylase-like protein
MRSLRIVAGVLALALGASAAYTVKPGDTLSGIAARLGVSATELARTNGITDPNLVYAGRSLALPGGRTASVPARTYVVVAGDNLSTIARRHGVTVTELARANHLDVRKVLRLGTRLAVPAPAARTGYPARLLASPDRLALVPHFLRWSKANGLPADLVMATTWLESGWQNGAVSKVGAIGIGQLMPGTVKFVRHELIGIDWLDPRIPEHNIRMSARYLRFLLRRSGGDVRTALAGYYQGPGSVARHGALPGTAAYVNGVLSLRRLFRSAPPA